MNKVIIIFFYLIFIESFAKSSPLQELKDLELKISQTSLEVSKNQENLQIKNNQFKQAQKKLQSSTKNLMQQQKIIATQIKIIADIHKQNKIKLIFDGSIGQSQRNLDNYSILFNFLLSKISDIQKELLNFDNLRYESQTQIIELKANLSIHQKNLEELKYLYEQRKKSISLLSKEQLTYDKERVIKETNKYKKINSIIEHEDEKLHLPIYGLTSEEIVNIDSTSLKNRFILKVSKGNSVFSVKRGQVVFADWLRGYGLLIIIDHGNGLLSLYGHNQTLFKMVGDWVSAGEKISLVGQSGGHSEDGLYFEMRKNGQSVSIENILNHGQMQLSHKN